jgi:hypothetical protein
MKTSSLTKRTHYITLLLGMVLCLSNPAIASELEDVVLMSLSAADGRAVVKTVDGTMHVLGEGDVIPGLGKENKTTILHIQPGRLG